MAKKTVKKKDATIVEKPKKVIVPLGDKVLIRPHEKSNEQRTEGGIILPGRQEGEKQERGVVIATGKGRWDEDGERRIPLDVSVGDSVIYVRGYEYQELKVDGVDFILISVNSILAITQ
jgi:chaperonin GroES